MTSIPALVKDFLSGAHAEYSAFTFSLGNLRKKIAERENFGDEKRRVLHSALKKQYSEIETTPAQANNIDALLLNNTFTVTTGHQLNLFTGPAFFIYKILQTIKTAEYLNGTFPGKNFVPVFWMATEDHDFEEIKNFKTDQNLYEISEEAGGAAGRIQISDNSFIHAFEKEFRDTVYGTELILLVKKAYAQGRSLSQAVLDVVQHLFANDGLICIDGDDAELKKAVTDIFKDELLNSSLKEHTAEKVEMLAGTYGKVQVNPRGINLFHLSATRNRIDRLGDAFALADTESVFSESQMLEELDRSPETFSPNALMRPVYQEAILPNIVYIGGNAEIMYWLELPDYFKYLALPFPVLVPRCSMLFLPEKTFSKISKLGLEIEDFFTDFNSIINQKIMSGSALQEILNLKQSELEQSYEALKKHAEMTDRTFKNLVAAEEKRLLNSFVRMKKRLLRAEKIKQGEYLERMENLYQLVHPRGSWQERVYNFSVWYSEFGPLWIRYCYRVIDVEKSDLIITQV